MARPAACVACRQNKLRCNASSTFPASCSRCAGRHIECKIDMNYKRVPTRNRVERLTQELKTLKASLQIQSNKDDACPSHPSLSQSGTPTGDCSFSTASRAEAIPDFLEISPHRTPTSGHDTVYKLEDLVLPETDVNELFQEYYARYHQQLPVLDEQAEPAAIIDASPLLFWTICFTASRNILPQQRYFPILCKKITGLLSNLMIVRHDSVYTMQALLILTMWPPPVRRQSDDMRWTYSGMTMQMALQAGCHRVGYEHEYHALTYSESPADERKHTQIWRCWCYVNSLLSCEFGLPCLVPFDALAIKPSDEAALPPDFISKLRIALYVSRINDTLGDSSPKDGRHWMAVARLLEKDLKSLVSELRKSSALWNSSVEYVYLGVLLYVYSFCLRWASAIPLSDPDHAIIQTSAAQSACRLIELYASSLLGPANETSPALTLCPQRYYAKSYKQFNTIALIILLKISAFNKISSHQLGEVNDAIRLGHSALMACSSSHGDESYRAAAVVEILCKRGIIKPVDGESPVQSRLGASLWLELLATAIRWRRQNSQERIRPRDSTSANNGDACNDSSDGTAIPLTISRVSGPGNAAVAAPTAVDRIAGPATTLANLQENISVFPFSVEDWSTYLDIIQTDNELGYDLGV